jgi:hypothetical protein
MLEAKIYGLCLERLRHQINKAKEKGSISGDYLLEGYNTGDIDDIIDILELYDLEERSYDGLMQKLDDLAYTVSVLTQEKLFFDFTEEGHLGLYITLNGKVRLEETVQEIRSSV